MYFETKRSINSNYIYTQDDENLCFVSHVHNSYEFITVLEGELECSVYHNTFTLKQGTAMLVLPNHVHGYTTNKYSRSFLCVFSADYVTDFYHEIKNGSWDKGNGVYAVFDYTDKGGIELLKNRKTNKFILHSILYGFCGRAYNSMVKNVETAKDEELIIKLLYYIFVFTILASTPLTNTFELSSPYVFANSTASLIATLNGISVFFNSYIANFKITKSIFEILSIVHFSAKLSDISLDIFSFSFK